MPLIPLFFTAECPRQEMDIAFLIDGSGSIDPKDFAQMKDFVKALMGEFASTSTLVNPEHCGLWKGDTCRKKAQHSWWGRKSRGRDHAGRSPGQCASSGLI